MKKHKVVYNAAVGGGLYLSNEAVEWIQERYKEYLIITQGMDVEAFPAVRGKVPDGCVRFWEIPRHAPVLVACIEALGEKANGPDHGWIPAADLRVFEITGQYYYIDDHDGGGEEVIDITKMVHITKRVNIVE